MVGFSVKKIAYLRKNFAERSENFLMRILYKYQLLKEFARVLAISIASISAGKVLDAVAINNRNFRHTPFRQIVESGQFVRQRRSQPG